MRTPRGGEAREGPGLYFVGLPFQTSFASATLRGVGFDAELVVARARPRRRAHLQGKAVLRVAPL